MGMIMSLPLVELEHQFSIARESLVFAATMAAFKTEDRLIPPAGALHISNCD